jgi:hypothetical protein
MALLHMLQVKPLACKETLLTCAVATIEKVMATSRKIFFIPLFFIYFFMNGNTGSR